MPPQQLQLSKEQSDTLIGLANRFSEVKRDNMYSGEELRDKLITGVNKVVDIIKTSYGPGGSNVILEADLYPFHLTTNDGKTIVQGITLADSIENIGANIAKEVADKTDKESGDGRKTSMILLQAILKEGLKHTADAMSIKRSLDECLPIILKSIDEQTTQISTSDIGKVAEVASESKTLGKTYQEIYEKIGKDGIIELDHSGTNETFYEIKEGVRLLNCGFVNEYMANNGKGTEASYDFPYILIIKDKITSAKELDKVFQQVFNQGKQELVIFFNDIDSQVFTSIAKLHFGLDDTGRPTKSPFKSLLIKAPVLWKDWLFEDFAKITGATIVDSALGKTLKGFQLSWLGCCDKIVTSKNETIVIGIKDITDHLAKITEEKTDDSKIRAARLQTKTSILKLGANSESELSYVKGKALDGRNASYLALNGGVVEGAGISLANIELEDIDTIGAKILGQALLYPYKQIKQNMGIDTLDEIGDVRDPAIVVKNAITNALSVASMILTTKAAITLKK